MCASALRGLHSFPTRRSSDLGDFKKIVPVIFETGHLARGDYWRFLVSRLSALPPRLWAYGYSYQNHGLIGATPELLFRRDRKSTRLNSSHTVISYAVFCLKQK